MIAAPLNEDLEDGEIFDDDDEVEQDTKGASTQPISASAAETPAASSPVPAKKRPLSPQRNNDRRSQPRQRRTKRTRDDDRPFPRKRRRSDEHDKEIGEEEEDEDGGGVGGGNRRNRGRDNFQNRRRMRTRTGNGRRGGNRRGGGGGGGDNMCKFYHQGKCHRGPDCPYSHGNSHRKYELCKFYMNDCCTKKDKCLFMHNDFPCKFYHLGLKCYAGKRCKFSHTKVSSYVKQQLIKYNQSESDKHFLHNLETTSPRESPSNDHHMDGDSPQHHHHNRNEGRGGQNHHRRHRSNSGGRRHNHQDMRRSVSPPHSDHNEEDRQYYEEQYDQEYNQHYDQEPPSQNHHDSSYSDDERNRTPMPSPSQDNSSDRDMKSPEPEPLLGECSSTNSDTPAFDQKDSGLGEEMPQEVPLNLPRKQRELYLRIQQQQRHTEEEQNAEGGGHNKEDDYRDEDWYSSDEDGNNAPLATILRNIKDKKTDSRREHIVPEILPDIDVSAVSKLLTTVRETIQQQQHHHSHNHKSNTHSSNETKPMQESKRRVRDPRLRTVVSPPFERRSNDFVPILQPLTIPSCATDLRFPPAAGSITSDVDLRQLPFKPAPVHQAANEIDASITSHPPIVNYSLIAFPTVAKPDYTLIQPKNTNDPRLKRYIAQPLQPMSLSLPTMMGGNSSSSGSQATTARDPRQRIINDPRRRPLLPQPLLGHHVSHPKDSSDLLGHSPFSMGNDVDLRFQLPSPNFSCD